MSNPPEENIGYVIQVASFCLYSEKLHDFGNTPSPNLRGDIPWRIGSRSSSR